MTQESQNLQLTQSRTPLDFTIDPFEKDPHNEEAKRNTKDFIGRFLILQMENQFLRTENHLLKKELELSQNRGVLIRGKRVVPMTRKELMQMVGCKDPRTLESKYGFLPMRSSDLYDLVECIEKLKEN